MLCVRSGLSSFYSVNGPPWLRLPLTGLCHVYDRASGFCTREPSGER